MGTSHLPSGNAQVEQVRQQFAAMCVDFSSLLQLSLGIGKSAPHNFPDETNSGFSAVET